MKPRTEDHTHDRRQTSFRVCTGCRRHGWVRALIPTCSELAGGAAAFSLFLSASRFSEPIGSIAAAGRVVTIPMVMIVLRFQRRIVAGLTGGAVKG
jgi:ABC-type glycerol-3-phosphate transport system permease component